ncbi:CheW domain-containing protein [Lederbergia sp. NSJ-179]|uniref:chemotaxis protein CheW n=1 Tax=Lederbergia sp. NSJ-179 TaxID=2931402 RepID=UPI001FD202D4|nr:CheW domain-containing protein [Lederbergia sp. NSJ-179]MCJ7839381.1 CheW domain-containing protein [Lederbergia sp. NSJ-179]
MSITAVIFNAGKEEYAIPVQYVVSIDKIEKIDPTPHLPVYMRGVVKSRGESIPVLDLATILYESVTPMDMEARLLVIDTEELSYGLFVHEAKEILEIPSDTLRQVELVSYQKTKYFSSIAILQDRLITMIDPVELLHVLDGLKEIKDYMVELRQEA